ncbi:MAG: AzlD domain-containing protein [Treponema sp.]|jgi:branched-subunit amino acid transport protein AzlD|nr:AzlD domain-containing protein [Treponema sp.]
MKTGIGEAVLLTAVMALVIFFCRVCPFLLFRGKSPGDKNAGRRAEAFIDFIGKIVPPLAMTVLTFNAVSASVYESVKNGSPGQGGAAFIAAAVTVIVHLWRRNALFSIFGGTAAFMALERLINF